MKKRLSRQRKTGVPPSPRSTSDQKGSTPDKVFPVVGVGASAGGLEAFSALLANLPDTTDMAFVFLQHLDPSHNSTLEEILSRTTKIPVTQVTEGIAVERNHIYIIPPNTDMVIRDGTLRLSARSLTHGQHRPIDQFLMSLAADCGDRSVAVILSGTASDGTSGCLAIKAVGGITFAQDEASAKYTSMPRSAIEAGCVDFVLAPRAIAEELARIEKHPYIARIPTRPDQLLGPASPRRKELPLVRQNERLTREIRQLRSQLQNLIEEHETTSKEFKTANEEVLSAKEELQSSNEELTTVNEELQKRNLELSTANNDLLNVLENFNLPVVLVNHDVRISRFTPAAQKLLNLLPSDVGRHLSEIRPNVDLPDLEDLARQTIESTSQRELEVRDAAGTWYMLRARPYKTAENKIEGAVITLQDIDALKRLVDETRAYADTLIETARESILILDANLNVVVANPAFYDAFQVLPAETVNRRVFELGNQQWDIPALRRLLESILRDKVRVDDFEVRHNFEHIGERVMLLNARRLGTKQSLIFLSIEDVTERHRAKEALERQAALLNLAHDTVIVRNMKDEILFWNRGAEEMYGWGKDYAIGKITHELLHTEFSTSFQKIEEELKRDGHWEGELIHTTKAGDRRVVNSRWALLQQSDAEPVILEINTDISDQKQSQESLRRLSAYLMTLQDEERRRIARELHDSTGQKLAAAKLQLDTLVKSGNLKSHEAAIAETAQWIDDCFQEVRTLSQLLHPPLLDEAGLLSATRWMVDGFSERAKIQVDLKVAGEVGRLPQPVELALFRVIQESLSNIRRHSGANKAQIKLARADGVVTLEIRDNGKGIAPKLLSKSGPGSQVVGVGILGMRERLSQLGGTLEIESDKSGTTVKVQVPIAAAAAR